MSKPTVTAADVKHISQLAQIPISKKEEQELAQAFIDTLKVVDELRELNVKDVPTTHQVTGLENSWREDKVNKTIMFSQQEALANSNKTHSGYFLVPKILEAKDT